MTTKTAVQTRMNDPRLQNYVALVTGASRGVGKGIAVELARAGCTVAVNHKSDKDSAAQTVSEIKSFGGNAFHIAGDVRSSRQVKQMFDVVLDRLQRLDILVNNAGTQTWAPLLDLSEADWDKDINTNLTGCFLCTQAAARWMKKFGHGVIINIGSGANKVPFPRLISYTASKGGIEMLTKVAAIELAPYSIRVNCVAPGAVLIERTVQESADYAKIWGGNSSRTSWTARRRGECRGLLSL
jgi:NAD(P)-dependent dehydrogenase (short-subunit alcohol dehydrogenase family)